MFMVFFFFFFFQAEDGIRDGTVTGVQTCALPILARGQILFTEGELCRGLHVVLEGRVELRQVSPRDRKSVVKGKSVDLGGRRIIKKKKKKKRLRRTKELIHNKDNQ